LVRVLQQIHEGTIQCIARDTAEPSALAAEILNARPYAFLDDAPLEERRTQAVYTRRATESSLADDAGALDPAAIDRVREEQRPDPRDADELHDALLTAGFLTAAEIETIDRSLLEPLIESRRAGKVLIDSNPSIALWTAAERLPEIQAIHPDAFTDFSAPLSRAARRWSREEALVELLRGRLTITGPASAPAIASSLAVPVSDVDLALLSLEAEGVVLRGRFTSAAGGVSERALEWCDRRLLARIHRYTLNRLRAEIEPVSSALFMQFLFEWQHLTPATRLTGIEGMRQVIAQLEGFGIAATAWERHILPSRIEGYVPAWLDALCLTGEVGWARAGAGIALFPRANRDAWLATRTQAEPIVLTDAALQVVERLRRDGASFFSEAERSALDELVEAGLVTSDGFVGRKSAGRWSLTSDALIAGEPAETSAANAHGLDSNVALQARALLRRYGVVFRRVVAREANTAPWRDLARIYRRLEARGEIRGGRFVTGASGEQFALPEAVEQMREIRRRPAAGSINVISAADPLNLTGVFGNSERVRSVPSHRLAYRDGVAVSVMEGDYLRPLESEIDETASFEIAAALAGRRVSVTRGFVGR
ncbi:MAG TPA: ATP-dependent DNA helicase, partial [Thermoanaerobaculia bacterium]|nr:ATP-dependent DNA helicase [Thermoanaerobaculia bacterium]